MKTSIIGCDYFNDYQVLKWKLDELKVSCIYTCSNGKIDKLAARYAKENNIQYINFWTEVEVEERWFQSWRQYYKLLESGDVLLAFWYGESNGITGIVDKARRMGKEVIIVRGYHPGANIPKSFED